MSQEDETEKTQTTGLKRKTIDKYYTSKGVVMDCCNLIKKHITISDDDICIEPSAGNGSFIPSIKSLFKNYHFYDIEPENSEIQKQDYLQLDYQENILNKYNNPEKNQYKKIHILGNPPFGRQSTLAIKFIKISAKFSDSISFILPRSFKKDSLKKHFPLYFHLICEYDLPKDSFLVDDKKHNVPCVFQIWVKKDEKRYVPKKLVPDKYKFVKKDVDHDISFRRVGVYAGEVSQETADKSPQSHYFIKFNDDIFTEELFKKMQNIKYKKSEDTVGPKSISKQELIKEFSVVLKGD